MSDKSKYFRPIPEQELNLAYRDGTFRVAYVAGARLLTLEEADLDVEQARKLRDWLNELVP